MSCAAESIHINEVVNTQVHVLSCEIVVRLPRRHRMRPISLSYNKFDKSAMNSLIEFSAKQSFLDQILQFRQLEPAFDPAIFFS